MLGGPHTLEQQKREEAIVQEMKVDEYMEHLFDDG